MFKNVPEIENSFGEMSFALIRLPNFSQYSVLDLCCFDLVSPVGHLISVARKSTKLDK